ncbi:MAG TPA: hypothetical protein PLS14_01715 [Bacteroidales bacterium]|nr:hypothetical protein [Bacteroidales bacterium]HQD58314.1 hypothetical protein [Bacteroidales bacterium]
MISKKLFLTIVFGTLIIASASLYIIADSDLYYYGKNNLPIYNKLPFEMKPEYWGYRRGMLNFVILDKNDFVHIGRGVGYWEYPEITIDSVISYGYNDTLLIAIVKDSCKQKYCLRQYDTLSEELIPLQYCNIEKLKHDYNLKWIENPNNPPYLIMSKRFRSAFIFYISLILFIVYFSKYLKEKHKEKNNNIH